MDRLPRYFLFIHPVVQRRFYDLLNNKKEDITEILNSDIHKYSIKLQLVNQICQSLVNHLRWVDKRMSSFTLLSILKSSRHSILFVLIISVDSFMITMSEWVLE